MDPRRVVALTGWADCIQLLKSFVSLFFRISALLSLENRLQETCPSGQLTLLVRRLGLYPLLCRGFFSAARGLSRESLKNCVQSEVKVS